MQLDEGDKAIMRSIAFDAADHSAARVKETTDMALNGVVSKIRSELALHAAECPVKAEVAASRNKLRGGWHVIVTVAALISGLSALVISWIQFGRHP